MMAVISNDQKDKHIDGADCNEQHKQDQLKMADSSTDQDVKVGSSMKEVKVGASCHQKDQSRVADSSADPEVKVGSTEKEEKVGGTTCHQCRQKIKGLSASCKNRKKDRKKDRTCPNKFCHRCLLNRYGEDAKKKSASMDWNCPKCKGICNCSICMKRRGQEPTGILAHKAKSTGYSSVSDMLLAEGSKALVPKKRSIEADEGHESDKALDKPLGGSVSMVKHVEGVIDLNSDPVPSSPEEKSKKKMRRSEPNDVEEIPLPRGTESTAVAGIQVPQEDVGHALQFLEFCYAFKEVLDLKEAEPEYILLELIRGGNGCRGKQSPVIRFHIILLSLIHKDIKNETPVLSYKSGKTSWLHALKNYASKYEDFPEKLKLDGSNLEADEYENLGSSTRLRLLNFLCDEVLHTVKMRNWIDDRNAEFAEKSKKYKERLQAAKQKENQLKQRMQDEVAKAVIANNGVPLLPADHEAVVSQIRNEVDKAHAEVLEAKNMISYEEQSCNAARTEPLISDIKGRIYWRLKGYSNISNFHVQDIGNCDGSAWSEKWCSLDAEQVKEVEEHIPSLRKRKASRPWVFK